jgi:hypothetical protein
MAVRCSIALALGLGGCGEGGKSGDAGASEDGSTVIDAAPQPDAMDFLSVYGMPCADDEDCGLGGFCLDEDDEWPADGYCSKTGCLSDTACGAGAFCGDDNNCYARCFSGDTCTLEGRICTQTIEGGGRDFGHEGCFPGEPASDGAPCVDFADCHPTQYCDAHPWNSPGGFCQTAMCTPGDDSTCNGDGHCYEFLAGSPVCVDVCETDGDCREAEGYTCYDSLNPDIGKYCAMLTQTGDACSAASCGAAPWECLTDASFTGADLPGGYCGALCDPGDPSTCNQGQAVCHDPSGATGDEHCVRTCTLANEATVCRTGEGYSCEDLDGGGIGTARGCIQ